MAPAPMLKKHSGGGGEETVITTIVLRGLLRYRY
jgi:hypothetical protein